MLPLLLGITVATAAPTKRKPDDERGKALYSDHCWMCHGKRGLGDGPSRALLGPEAPPLAGRVPVETWPAHTALIQQGEGSMPGFSSILGVEETRCILTWLERLDPETGEDPEGDKVPAKPTRRPSRDEAGDAPGAAPDAPEDDAQAPGAQAADPDDAPPPQ